MRAIVLLLVGLVVMTHLGPGALQAQSSAASLTVSASVSKNCTISTTTVNFGAYDPVTANSTTPLDGSGAVTLTCTKGAITIVGLDNGSNSDGTNRRMSSAGATYLGYQVYKDAARTRVWGDGLIDSLFVGPAPNRLPRTFPIFGRVPGGQNATVGSYTDTVLASVNF